MGGKFGLASIRLKSTESLLGSARNLRITPARDLPQQLGQKPIVLRYLDLVVAPANLHIKRPFPMWQAGDTRGAVAHKAPRALASRSTKPIALCDAPPAYDVQLFRADI